MAGSDQYMYALLYNGRIYRINGSGATYYASPPRPQASASSWAWRPRTTGSMPCTTRPVRADAGLDTGWLADH